MGNVERKRILLACLVLILILSIVSACSHPSFKYSDNTNYKEAQQKDSEQQKAYADYLAQLHTTPEAQTAMYQQILPPAEVQQQVAEALRTDQEIQIPATPKTKVKVVQQSGKDAVVGFFNASNPIIDNLNTITTGAKDDFFNQTGDMSKVDSLIKALTGSLSSYAELPVPEEVANFQNKQLVAFEAYLDLAKLSKSYMNGQVTDPWPDMYKYSSILGESAHDADGLFSSLAERYKLADNTQRSVFADMFVPVAHAQLATVDIWAKAQQILEVAAATAAARFMLDLLNRLAVQIQKAYTITNFLYYSDALTNKYVNDYLNKYVTDPADKSLILNFIPAISCGVNQDYRSTFQSKADLYLGFDPSTLDPNDPQYYTKLARVGNFLSTPEGWDLYYQDAAAQAQSSAQQAALNELTSPGNKSARDIAGNIILTAQTTVDAMRATLQNMLASGFAGYSKDGWTAQIASGITQTFLNKFLFQGAVLQEQKACIAAPRGNILSTIP